MYVIIVFLRYQTQIYFSEITNPGDNVTNFLHFTTNKQTPPTTVKMFKKNFKVGGSLQPPDKPKLI